MRIPRFSQRQEHGAGPGSARPPAANPAAAAGPPSPGRANGACVEPAGPGAALGEPAVTPAVEHYWEAWREAATDAELAFGWWVGATVLDRTRAATGYFAAFEREERAAFAYQDAWQARHSGRAHDRAETAAAAS